MKNKPKASDNFERNVSNIKLISLIVFRYSSIKSKMAKFWQVVYVRDVRIKLLG